MMYVMIAPVIKPNISNRTSVIQPFLSGMKCCMVSSMDGVSIQNDKKLMVLFLNNGSN